MQTALCCLYSIVVFTDQPRRLQLSSAAVSPHTETCAGWLAAPVRTRAFIERFAHSNVASLNTSCQGSQLVTQLYLGLNLQYIVCNVHWQLTFAAASYVSNRTIKLENYNYKLLLSAGCNSFVKVSSLRHLTSYDTVHCVSHETCGGFTDCQRKMRCVQVLAGQVLDRLDKLNLIAPGCRLRRLP